MAKIVKNLSAPYLITSNNATEVSIGSDLRTDALLTVNGNLVVTGSQTTVNSTNVSIVDNIIVLNKGETGDGVTLSQSGITVDRGPNPAFPNVSILWDETMQCWTLVDGIAPSPLRIATIGIGATYISAVVEDTTPKLGGNLSVNGFSITTEYNQNLVLTPSVNVQLDAPLQLTTLASPPTTPAADASLLFGGNVAGGATGVYTTNSSATNEELISKKRAIVYSLIF